MRPESFIGEARGVEGVGIGQKERMYSGCARHYCQPGEDRGVVIQWGAITPFCVAIPGLWEGFS